MEDKENQKTRGQEPLSREEQDRERKQALEELYRYVCELARRSGESGEYARELWRGICASDGLLRELAYYHDYGSFLCEYRTAGYTLADALVWQVDHFKLYMDRPSDMNRYRQERLLLAAFETMIRLEKDPGAMSARIQGETGQDIQPGM